MSVKDAGATQGRRKRLILILGSIGTAIVLAALIAVMVLNPGGGDPGLGEPLPPGQSMRPTSGPDVTTSSESPSEEELTSPPSSEAFPELNPVPPEGEVEAGDDLTIRLTGIEAVSGVATIPGEIAGDAIRVTVEIANGGDMAFSVSNVIVNAYSGSVRTPLLTLVEPGAEPFQGEVAEGAKAEGVYVFVAPIVDREDIVISVDYAAGSPAAIFQGDFRTD